jgi:hypothetical protein
MKIMKWSSIFLLSILFMSAFIPELSARHHHRRHTSFGLSFNVNPTPNYAIVPAPAVVAPAPMAVYRPYYGGAVYPYYPAPVYIERHSPRVYVQPGFSYSYWRY